MSDFARWITTEMTLRGGITFARRADGAAVIHRDLDLVCRRPPRGWFCPRGANHDGPCAAHPTKSLSALEMQPRTANELLAIIPANEWASIISSMCSDGEDG